MPISAPAVPSEPPTAEIDRLLHADLAMLTGGFSAVAALEATFDWAAHLAMSPGRRLELLRAAAADIQRLAGLNTAPSAENAPPARHDPRFQAEAWQQWPFSSYAQTFQAVEGWWLEAASHVPGVSRAHEDLLRFMARQILDSVAPSNLAATNPEVLERIRQTGGRCLIDGSRIAADDALRALSNKPPAEAGAFRVGTDVAATEGTVILRTPLCEVIQYKPVTETVQREPVLFVPAWINRFYILDLEHRNSMVRHMVERGFTVFMVSWKNPTPEDRDVSFDDYRRLGVLPAIEAALAITGAERLHGVGYCLGGTLLTIVAAAMARDGDERLASLSFLAAQFDFDEAGELKVFVNESQLTLLEDMMWRRGVLAGQQMRGAFHLLRSNDLIWSKLVRQYLMGEPTVANAMAAWAADSTRMPYRMHSDYLRSLYLNNDLAEGRFKVDGRAIEIQDIRAPVFALGTEWDHVAPWHSVYKFGTAIEGEVTFALTNGGHNQGVVSQPGRPDRRYRIATHAAGDRHLDPDRWIASVAPQEGSWWPAWFDWLEARSTGRIAAPPVGRPDAGYAPLMAAPGLYVTE